MYPLPFPPCRTPSVCAAASGFVRLAWTHLYIYCPLIYGGDAVAANLTSSFSFVVACYFAFLSTGTAGKGVLRYDRPPSFTTTQAQQRDETRGRKHPSTQSYTRHTHTRQTHQTQACTDAITSLSWFSFVFFSSSLSLSHVATLSFRPAPLLFFSGHVGMRHRLPVREASRLQSRHGHEPNARTEEERERDSDTYRQASTYIHQHIRAYTDTQRVAKRQAATPPSSTKKKYIYIYITIITENRNTCTPQR